MQILTQSINFGLFTNDLRLNFEESTVLVLTKLTNVHAYNISGKGREGIQRSDAISPKIHDTQAFSSYGLKERRLKVAALNLPRLGETES
jgi:hypothetical protein